MEQYLIHNGVRSRSLGIPTIWPAPAHGAMQVLNPFWTQTEDMPRPISLLEGYALPRILLASRMESITGMGRGQYQYRNRPIWAMYCSYTHFIMGMCQWPIPWCQGPHDTHYGSILER